jgi:hypothetical protein
MLTQVRRHYEQFQKYLTFGSTQRERELAAKERKQETFSEFQADTADLLGEQDAGMNARHGFSIVLTELCNQWDARIDSIQNILTPTASTSSNATPNIGMLTFPA